MFTALLAYFFLHEVFNPIKYIGMISLLIGAVMISYKKVKGKPLPLTPILLPIMLSGFMYSVAGILDKFFLLKYDYWSLLFWQYFGGLVVGGVVALKKSNRSQLLEILTIKRKRLILVCATIAIYYVADISWVVAVSQAPVSLVTALSTTEPFFVLVIMLLLSVFVPRILKEEISKSVVSLKVVSIVLIMLGTYFVAV